MAKRAVKKKTTTGESNLPKKQNPNSLEALNPSKSEDVGMFLEYFNQGKMGECLRMLNEGKVYLIDPSFLQEKANAIAVYQSNQEALVETLKEREEDLSSLVDATAKIQAAYEPVKEITDEFAKKFSGSSMPNPITAGTMVLKIFRQLKKKRKFFEKLTEGFDADQLKAILAKYGFAERTEIVKEMTSGTDPLPSSLESGQPDAPQK